MIDLREIRSLTDFQRNTKEHLDRMKKTQAPMVLTVNGKAELVVQDADAYQQVMERLHRAETVAAVRAAQDEFDRGGGRPAREALDELRAKHGIPD